MSSQPPSLPSDLGMTGLGHVMRPSAGMALAINAFLTIQAFAIPTRAFRYFAVAFLVSGLVRSWLHLDAGSQLASTSPNAPKTAARYCWFAFGQSAVAAGLSLKFVPQMQVGSAVAMFVVLIAWPLAVFGFSQRSAVRKAFQGWMEEDAPPLLPNDRGLQGAGLLMIIFGLMGTLFGLAYLVVIIPALGQVFSLGLGGIFAILLLLASCGRSLVHFRTGLFGLTADYERLARGVNHYLLWAVIWGVCMLGFVFAVAGIGGLAVMQLVIFILVVMTLWPGHLTGVVNAVQYWDDDDEDVPRGPAVDGGLSAVGFALTAYGVFGVTFQALGQLGLLGEMSGLMTNDTAGRVLGWIVSSAALWAGLELALMTRRYKVAALTFAASGVVAGIWTMVEALGELSSQMWMTTGLVAILISMSLAVAFPAAVGWLALRPLPKTRDIGSIFD